MAEEFTEPSLPGVRPATAEIPVYQPINLTEQISMEYSGAQRDPFAVAGFPAVGVPGPYGPLPKRPTAKTPRPATIVWGFVVLAIGLGLLASAFGQTIDYGLAAIVLLGAAGLALVAVAAVSAVRRSITR